MNLLQIDPAGHRNVHGGLVNLRPALGDVSTWQSHADILVHMM